MYELCVCAKVWCPACVYICVGCEQGTAWHNMVKYCRGEDCVPFSFFLFFWWCMREGLCAETFVIFYHSFLFIFLCVCVSVCLRRTILSACTLDVFGWMKSYSVYVYIPYSYTLCMHTLNFFFLRILVLYYATEPGSMHTQSTSYKNILLGLCVI